MAHVSLSQSLVLLAAALCFAGVHGAANTTTVKPTTAAPTTANMTTAAPTTVNMTTAAPTTVNMTTAAQTTMNMTTAASNMTTAASNMTTAAINMTTAPSNMTTAPINMTTAPSNMTTTPSNMTTAPSNMTTIPSNMTTIPSNMTTAPSNMTTAAIETTTAHPMTTSVPEPKWKVKNKENKTCMLMDFGGTITYKGATYQIPSSASDAKSSCPADFSKFVVEFADLSLTSLWQLVLNFTITKNSFKLHSVAVTLYQNSVLVASGKVTKDFFDVPFGDYYYCDSLNVTAIPFNVNMTRPRLQPFVQKTKGGDNLGDKSQCSTSRNNKANIIIGVVVAVIVLIAAIVVTYVVVKRRGKPSDPPYARVQ